MKRVLITGANGYIGSHLVKELLKHEEMFTVITTDIKKNNIDTGAEYIYCNIMESFNDDDLFTRLGKPDILVYLAWQDGFNHNANSHIDCLHKHYGFISNMLDHGLQHLAVAGSFREYGKTEGCATEDIRVIPNNMYALTKTALYDAIRIKLQGTNAVCFQWLRPFTVYGDDEQNQSIFSKIIQWEKEGRVSFPFTDGKEQYDYISVNELARQIVAIIGQTEVEGIIDCCSGEPTRLGDKVEEFLREKHFQIRPEYGAFPRREYDSQVIYGNREKIDRIQQKCKLF